MTPGSHPVNVRQKNAKGEMETVQVGIAQFPIYDSVSEAIDEGGGEAKVLELINAQTRTNALNTLRALHRPGGTSKTALRNAAMGLITSEDFMPIAALENQTERAKAMEELIERKMVEAQAQIDAKRGTEAGEDPDAE